MEYTLASAPQTVISRRNSSTAEESKAFKAIEVDLFSYNVHEGNYQRVIAQVAGDHFTVVRQPDVSESYATFCIAPKDYALVDGGMMYTTAGRIIADLIGRGFLIQGYWTIK